MQSDLVKIVQSLKQSVASGISLSDALEISGASEEDMRAIRDLMSIRWRASSPIHLLRVDELRRLAAEGLTIREASEKMGVSLNTVYLASRGTDIQFRRKLSSKSKPDRDAALIEEANSGDTFASLSKKYGLTKQRVHQICRRAGHVPRQRRMSEEHIAMLSAMKLRPVTLLEAMEAIVGPSKLAIVQAAKRLGVTFLPSAKSVARMKLVAEIAEQAKGGGALMRFCKGDGSLRIAVAKYMDEHGMQRRKNNRLTDFSHRRKIISEAVEEGAGYNEIAKRIKVRENRSDYPSFSGNIKRWTENNMPEVASAIEAMGLR